MTTININRVVLTGNLTQYPELRSTPGATPVCGLRIASNCRRKDATSGAWTDKPNYVYVTIFGAQGENAARYLAKGRGVAIDGRLGWREWQTPDGTKRQAIQIIADIVQSSALHNTHPRASLTAERPAPRSAPTTTSRSDPTAHCRLSRGQHSASASAGTRRLGAASAYVAMEN
jgi:single-strand DNA-binding protein